MTLFPLLFPCHTAYSENESAIFSSLKHKENIFIWEVYCEQHENKTKPSLSNNELGRNFPPFVRHKFMVHLINWDHITWKKKFFFSVVKQQILLYLYVSIYVFSYLKGACLIFINYRKMFFLRPAYNFLL